VTIDDSKILVYDEINLELKNRWRSFEGKLNSHRPARALRLYFPFSRMEGIVRHDDANQFIWKALVFIRVAWIRVG
jgi:hypothetical protein